MTLSRILYGSTIFLSAFLLFLVEPMAAKELLPALGGSSAVWITCLVFFQLMLLLGYLYAHWLSRQPRAGVIHRALLSAAVVVVAISSRYRPNLADGAAHPVATIFSGLALSIGVPFLLLGSTSPLLQVWSAHEEAGVPFRLFALSNGGSLLALLLYPTVVEPYLTLGHQRMAWSAAFVIYAAVCAVLAAGLKKGASAALKESATAALGESVVDLPGVAPGLPRPALRRSKALWFLLPLAAALQLSAVTSHLTSDIAAVPLLWIMPLAVYLMTFILAFELPGLYRRWIAVRFLVLMLASLGYALSKADATLPIGVGILFFLVELFIACFFCHAELFALRPHRASEATLFYLLIAGGGVTGTFFVAIASPLLFAGNYDVALSFLVTAILAFVVTWRDGWAQRLLWATGCALLLGLCVTLHLVYARQTMLEVRNFYGTLRVKESNVPPEMQPVRLLLNGTIQHGTQGFAAGMSSIPTTYYAADSGVGLVIAACCGSGPKRVGVVGLGVGTMAAYARKDDYIRFYEINPLVGPIAQNLFTYLRDARSRGAQISIAEGDARASLAQEPPQAYQLLVIDAFSGDAIPLHLLTVQAMRLYQRQLAPGGILAFHVSNQYLNLAPEIQLLAAASGLEARRVDSPANEARGEFQAAWVIVAPGSFFQEPAPLASQSFAIPPVTGLRLWTDDYSSLLPVMRWGRQ